MRCCLIPALACLLGTASAADVPPMITISLPDGARLLQHFDDSLYAKVWNEPRLAELRARAADALKPAEEKLGVSLIELVRAAHGIEARIGTILPVQAGTTPRFSVRGDLGPHATTLMRLLRENSEPSKVITLPGADEALQSPAKPGRPTEPVVARFGNRLVMSTDDAVAEAARPALPANDADLTLDVDYGPMIAALERGDLDPATAKSVAAFQHMKHLLTPIHWEIRLEKDGIRERITQQAEPPGTMPAERGLLAHLPATTLMAVVMGFDSSAWWKLFEPLMLDVAKQQQGKDVTVDDLRAEADKGLADAGIPLGLKEMIDGFKGSLLVAATPGSPFPAVTIAFPRSRAVDELMAFAAKKLMQGLPAEGTISNLALPNLPLPISLLVDKTHWIATTDALVASGWNSPPAADNFTTTPAGKQALERAPEGSYLIGASATPAVLRTLAGFIPLIPGGDDPKAKQLVTVLVARLASQAAPGYLFGRVGGGRNEVEARGLLGMGVVPIIAGIAIPNLLESKVMANEAAAAGQLKSGVFPAEIQFQGGLYADQDGDGIGEFGFLAELAGGPVVGQKDEFVLSLMTADFKATTPERAGYRYIVYLPDGQGGALTAAPGARPKNIAAAKEQSKHFVAYAWPASSEGGRRIFAITEEGVVRASKSGPAPAEAPPWNALWNDKGWEDPPAWEPHKKR